MVILIVGKKTQTPQILAPCQDKDGAGSEIYYVYLWLHHRSYLELQSILLLIHSETKIVSRDNSKNWVNLNNLLVSVPQNKETRNIPYPVQNWKVNNIKLNELQGE